MDLQSFFKENPSVALAFSGGTDSSYLLYAAKNCNARVKAYFVKTVFQPAFELEDAKRIAMQLGADFEVLSLDILAEDLVAVNPENRCYYCKKTLFGALKKQAAFDGFSVLMDGTNASDDASDRPGMKALMELSVRSPLRECGITKDEVRSLSKDAGLFTWEKCAYACLATRIPTGRKITSELLLKVEKCEDALFELGFSDFRVRVLGEAAKLQFPLDQLGVAFTKRDEIMAIITPHFATVLLDFAGR